MDSARARFGIRQYATGREVYIAQTRMGGRVRTVTIAPASVILHHQALTVARRVLAYASAGYDPAADRQRIRSAPLFDDFPNEYWRRSSPQWKASTQEIHAFYRHHYLDGAFPGVFIDELNEAQVTQWFSNHWPALRDQAGLR